MQIEGLWTMEIFGLTGWEDMGVLLFEKGRMMGGNNYHYIIGTYNHDISEDSYKIKMKCNFMREPQTWFRVKDNKARAEIKGKIKKNVFVGSLIRKDIKGITIKVRFTKRTDLP